MSAEATDLIRDGDGDRRRDGEDAGGHGRHRGRSHRSPATAAIRPCASAPVLRSRKSARRWTCCGFAPASAPTRPRSVFARVEPGKMMVTFDRGDYWQCAYVIAKGQYDAVKARGLQALLDDVARMAPILKSGHRGREELGRREAADGGDQSPDALDAARDCCASAMPRMRCRRSAASASISRCRMRSRPPICWRQSSSSGCPSEDELDAVRRRREFPVRMTQRMQVVVQNNIISVGAEAGRRAVEGAAGRAADHGGAMAAGHHRALYRRSACGPSTCIRRNASVIARAGIIKDNNWFKSSR